MPRYELGGEYFWTIEIAAATVTTSLGKVGNDGHTRMKRFGTAAEAQREHDKQVAEKLDQGYMLVGAAAAKPARKRTAAATKRKPAIAAGKKRKRS